MTKRKETEQLMKIQSKKVPAAVTDPKIGSYEEMMLKHTPNVVVGISFVEYGYQADVWVRKTNGSKSNTYHCTTECRDFAGDHKITELTEEFMQRFWDLVEEFREGK